MFVQDVGVGDGEFRIENGYYASKVQIRTCLYKLNLLIDDFINGGTHVAAKCGKDWLWAWLFGLMK